MMQGAGSASGERAKQRLQCRGCTQCTRWHTSRLSKETGSRTKDHRRYQHRAGRQSDPCTQADGTRRDQREGSYRGGGAGRTRGTAHAEQITARWQCTGRKCRCWAGASTAVCAFATRMKALTQRNSSICSRLVQMAQPQARREGYARAQLRAPQHSADSTEAASSSREDCGYKNGQGSATGDLEWPASICRAASLCSG